MHPHWNIQEPPSFLGRHGRVILYLCQSHVYFEFFLIFMCSTFCIISAKKAHGGARDQHVCMCSHRWWLISSKNRVEAPQSRRPIWLGCVSVLTRAKQVNWKSNTRWEELLSHSAISALSTAAKWRRHGVSQCAAHALCRCAIVFAACICISVWALSVCSLVADF